MIFLTKFSSAQTKVAHKLFGTTIHQLPTTLKPPKANQALKNYLKSSSPNKVLLLFRNLLRKCPSSIDSFSLLYVLKACTHKSSLIEGKQLHALSVNLGFEPIIFLQTILIDMYSAAGSLENAHRVFDEIPYRNIVCWTALISAYVDNQKPTRALQLFRQMQMDNVEPDQITLTVALSGCADVGALDMGEWIHAYIRRKKGLKTDLCLDNALINMYAKCGDIGSARTLFDSIRKKDVRTWTSMIVGHALHGQAEEALKIFAELKDMNKQIRRETSLVLPNDVTFIGVLMACSHAGMVEEGKQHFKSMSDEYGLKPRESHFGCMLDLLCRAGLLKEAYDFILEMPVKPNAVMWRTLLGACSYHGNIEFGTEIRSRLFELEPSHVGDSVIMSNIFASKGMWDKKLFVRDQIKQRRAPGCSSIEVKSKIYEFVTADDSHSLTNDIYEVLDCLLRNMKSYGYCPELSSLRGGRSDERVQTFMEQVV